LVVDDRDSRHLAVTDNLVKPSSTDLSWRRRRAFCLRWGHEHEVVEILAASPETGCRGRDIDRHDETAAPLRHRDDRRGRHAPWPLLLDDHGRRRAGRDDLAEGALVIRSDRKAGR
jgi:hypothetical protein